MTRGRALAVTVLVLLVAIGSRGTVAAATETEVDLSVNGIRFGSTYEDVVRSIGRTRNQEREKVTDDSCGPPYTDLRLTYDGFFIRMKGTPKGTDFKAVSFDVTSPKWMIQPGIRVGMTEAELRKQIGEPGRTTEVEGTIVQHFVNAGNNGIANFFVKNGRLVRVAWEMKLC